MYRKGEILTVSNILSFSRFIFSSVAVWICWNADSFSFNQKLYSFIFMIILASTDFFDGYFARKFNQITELGKIIDPLADKAVVVFCFIAIFVKGIIPPYLFYLVIIRDLVIFLGGMYVAKRIGKVLPSNMTGKITVNVLSVYVLYMIFVSNTDIIAVTFEYMSVFFVLLSFIIYLLRAIESIKKGKQV